MLCENSIPKAVNIIYYVQNKILIRPILEKTPYILQRNRKSNISFFSCFWLCMLHP